MELNKTIDSVDLNLEIDIQSISIHILANLIKKYLNSLKEKLPSTFFEIDPRNINEYKPLLENVKNTNKNYFYLIERIIHLCKVISNNHEVNRMTSENLSIVISPNIYDDSIDFGMEFKKMVEPFTFMIDHYDELFSTFKNEFENEINSNLKKIQNQNEFKEEFMNNQIDIKEILASKLIEGKEDDKTMVLSLKDILRQGNVEIFENKKWVTKWIVVKRNCLMIFKNISEGQTKNILPFKDMFVDMVNKGERDCICLEVDKHTLYLSFNDTNDWFKYLTFLAN